MSPVQDLESRLWAVADELRANSKLKSSEYSTPVLGLIFLRFAEHRFQHAHDQLVGKTTGRRAVGKLDYQQQGVLYVHEKARFSCLRDLPDNEDIAKRINEAMSLIEAENDSLAGVLPKNYQRIDKSQLLEAKAVDVMIAVGPNFFYGGGRVDVRFGAS